MVQVSRCLDNNVNKVIAEYLGYIKKILRPKKLLISPGVAYKAQDIPELPDQTKQKYYSSFVAKLQFVATWILFENSFAVSQLARFCASAGSEQWSALYHLMEYLAAHPSFKIKYHRGTKLIDLLSGYANADWGNRSSSRSTSGMVMLYNKSPIMWKSKMQKTTALLTAEAEYYSASAAGCEVLYLLALLDSLGFKQKIQGRQETECARIQSRQETKCAVET
jgi:hypothetical protein